MLFTNLDFPGKLHADLINSNEVRFVDLRFRIESAWAQAPKNMRDHFKSLSGKNHISYRGLIFELYILEILCKGGFEVRYEFSERNSGPSIDFVAVKESRILLIEATSLGPNESQITKPNYNLDPEGYKNVRELLRSKLHKVSQPPTHQAILAVCNSFTNFLSSNFEKIQILYGAPALRIDLASNETSMVLSDQGIWAEKSEEAKGFSGIYFTDGTYPGFDSLFTPQIWLNPLATRPLQLDIWPQNADLFKSSDKLFQTSSLESFEWRAVPTIF